MFRSGDLGRLLPDGRLVCLGRRDSQVKVRGHRVEIIEVEMALRALREVKDAVVVARVDGAGAPRLIAHVVPRGSQAPTVTALRRRLTERLPEYMIPSRFVLHRTLPLAPNGKVDRSALPAPGDARPDLDTPLVAPRTPGERKVAAIWSEVLSITTVGIDDDLFALGGDSLLAMRILARVESELAVALPLDVFLEKPTIRALVESVVAAQLWVARPADRHHLLEESGRRGDSEAGHGWPPRATR
jgi:acyl carrier protein